MRKLIVSLVVVVVIGAGGYLSLNSWAQHTAAREVDALLGGWRAGAGTHGRIELDLWARTARIADVVVQPLSAPHPKITIGQVIASGLDLSGRAARIELIDVFLSDVQPGKRKAIVEQTAPRIVLTGFSARPTVPGKVETALDHARFWLEQLSAVAAAEIEIPSLTVVVTQDEGGRQSSPSYTQHTYTNLVLRGVRDGRVAEITVDGVALNGNIGAPFFVFKGQIGKSTLLDVDVTPLLALLDPSQPSRMQGHQRVSRQVSMGPQTLQMGLDPHTGVSWRIEGMVAHDISLDLGKLSLDDLTLLSELSEATPGALPAEPGQLAMLMDKTAGLYESIGLGKLDVQGLSVTGMGERVKLAGVRLERMENGRLGALAFEGLDVQPPFGEPAAFGRLAVTGLDLANLIRLLGAELAAPPGEPPSLDRIAQLHTLLEGFEIKGIEVPDPETRRKALIDASVTSGPRAAGLPRAEVRTAFKVSIPLSLRAPEPFNFLAAAGLSTLAAEADVGVRWDEATERLALAPATLEVAGVMAVSVKATLAKVSREAFSTDMLKALQAASETDVGDIEVTLHDLGVVDLLAAEIARAQGQAPEVGRALMLESWTHNVEQQAQLYPAARPFFEAVGRFLQGKGETLTVRLSPKGRVRLLALAEAFRLAPEGALLAAFNIEAGSVK